MYLAGICLKYLESGFQDPINKTIASYSASYAKALSALREQQGAHVFLLPSIFSTQLKSKLREESSYSLLEKRLLWSDFKLAFHGFLRASEFATRISHGQTFNSTMTRYQLRSFYTAIKDRPI